MIPKLIITVGLLLVVAAGYKSGAALARQPQRERLRNQTLAARELIFGGKYEAAMKRFAELASEHPASPAGDFYQAVTLVWKSHVDASLDLGARTYDGEIEAALASTIKKATALRSRDDKSDEDEAEGLYYLGSAYAIRSRLAFSQNHAIPAARAARTAQEFLGALIKLRPDYTDALFAAGSIYYRVGLLTDSPVGRLATTVLGPKALPAGDRTRGLAYLKTAAEKGDLTGIDAKFALVEVLTLVENRYDEALAYARELEANYPENQTVTRYMLKIYVGLKDRARITQTVQQILARVKAGRPNFGAFMKAEAEKALTEAAKL